MSKLRVKPWNPLLQPRDATHLTPIIMPVLPHTNVAFNVSRSTLRSIKVEMIRGMNITKAAIVGDSDWHVLFESFNLLHEYEHIIRIEIEAADEPSLLVWLPWVKVRLRFLVRSLETVSALKRIRPSPIEVPVRGDYPFSRSMHIGLGFDTDWHISGRPQQVKLKPIIEQFVNSTKAWAQHSPDMKLSVKHLRQTTSKNLVW
jgi:poly(A) polymerase